VGRGGARSEVSAKTERERLDCQKSLA